MDYDKKYKSLEITDREKTAIDSYRSEQYKIINSILELGIDNESEINSKLSFYGYNKENIRMAIDTIITMYSAMIKNSYVNDSKGTKIYRGTTKEEMSRMISNGIIDKFLSTTTDKSMAEGYFSLNWDNPAVATIDIKNNIPYIDLSRTLDDYGNNWEKEIVFSPFTKIESVKGSGNSNGKDYYDLSISRSELPEIQSEDRAKLYNEILDQSDDIGSKLNDFFELQKRLEELEFSRNNLSKKLSERGLDIEDRKYISEKIQNIDDESSRCYDKTKQYENIINEWKSKISSYCKAQCRQVEQDIEKDVKEEEKQFKSYEESENLIKANQITSVAKKQSLVNINDTLSMCDSISEQLEKVGSIQEQYEAKSNELGLGYKKFYDASHDTKSLTDLQNTLLEVKSKIEEISTSIVNVDKDFEGKKTQLDQLTRFSRDVRIMLNDMQDNNLHGPENKELSNLKNAIYSKYVSIKAEADRKKLDETERKINEKSGIRRLFDRITGQNKIDEFEKSEVKRERIAIDNKIFNLENEQANTENQFSLDELALKLDQFVIDNQGNSTVEQEHSQMLNLSSDIIKMFNINETELSKKLRFRDTSDEKSLTILDGKKVDKKTRIKYETDTWIEENGYSKSDDNRSFIVDVGKDRLSSGLERLNYLVRNSFDLSNADRNIEKKVIKSVEETTLQM